MIRRSWGKFTEENVKVTTNIEDDYREVTARRPWWFAPGLVGVALGALLGHWLLPEPLPPCSPTGASSETVVRRFLDRLGSSATAIEDCWASGRLGPEELRAYLDARRPASVSLLPDKDSGPFLLGPNAPDYAQWVAETTWSGPPPRAWPSDELISIELLRPNGSDRWTIVSAGKLARTTLSWTVQSSGGLGVLAAEIRAHLADELDRLAFVPLVPPFMPADITGTARIHTCGLALTSCLEYLVANRGIRLSVFQGPAGCCLDNDRPDAQGDVEIRPGVNAHFDPMQVQYGGPTLWWVEETARGRAFVAVSSPVFRRDELVAIARSMTPITRIP